MTATVCCLDRAGVAAKSSFGSRSGGFQTAITPQLTTDP
jgi:hypothetical protein